MKRFSVMFLFVALATANVAVHGQAQGTAGVQAAIDAAWKLHFAAAMKKDATAIAAIYAKDALYIVPGSSELRGRSAIEEMEVRGLASSDLLGAVHTTHALRVVGDSAYELGTVAGPVRVDGKAATQVTYNFMAMWQRQPDGTWLVRYLIGQS